MHDFQIGYIIRYEDKENGYVYGEVVDIQGDELQAEYVDDSWETFYISKKKRNISNRFISTKRPPAGLRDMR
ncbi:MAG: hypothetical protein II135_07460 [Clostridia bacterium]|nr:hypothetical protein [Clostridia bacterium]